MEDDVSFLDIRIPFNKHNVRSVNAFSKRLPTTLKNFNIYFDISTCNGNINHKKFWNWITK